MLGQKIVFSSSSIKEITDLSNPTHQQQQHHSATYNLFQYTVLEYTVLETCQKGTFSSIDKTVWEKEWKITAKLQALILK